MAFNSESDLIAGMRNGQWPEITKASQTAEGTGTHHSLWKAAGMPAAGATPPAFNAGSGYSPDRTTTGAISFSNPTSPAISVLAQMDLEFVTAGKVMICDRLWACSGFSTVSTSAQNVTTPGNLPTGRDPFSGADVQPFVEIYSAPGATGATWTMTGVDAAGNTGRTWTYIHPANAESVGQLCQLLPGGASPAAVLGCRQVTSLTCSASSGTAGDVGVTLLRRIGSVIARANNDTGFRDAYQLGLKQIYDDSCLMLRVLCSTTSTGLISGTICLAQN